MSKLSDYINQNVPIEQAWFECFGTTLPVSKFECPNPEHHHVSHTPSAKVFGNQFKCFGYCNRVFGVYNLYKWYRPDLIEEIKSSLIINQPNQEVKSKKIVMVEQGKLSNKQYLDLICQMNS